MDVVKSYALALLRVFCTLQAMSSRASMPGRFLAFLAAFCLLIVAPACMAAEAQSVLEIGEAVPMSDCDHGDTKKPTHASACVAFCVSIPLPLPSMAQLFGIMTSLNYTAMNSPVNGLNLRPEPPPPRVAQN